MKRPTIMIFAKPPRIGLSKTRLARELGSSVEARRIATMTQAKTIRAAMSGNWQTILYAGTDKDMTRTLGGLWPAQLERRSQGGGDLSDRLSKGLREAPPGPVIFIGADAPDISPALLRQAVRLLSRNDAVFGPAKDGGFWLFGLNKTANTPSPFYDVRWSSLHAMEDVWANLPDEAHVGLLPDLIDIDGAQDLEIWHNKHDKEVQDLTEASRRSASKKPGFFARLFGGG